MSVKVKHDVSRRPLPEVLGRGDVDKGGAWTVEACPPTRGLPVTSVEGRFMNVPMSGDALSTVIRIHEMVHAKVSPKDLSPFIARGFATEESLRSVEEMRVNYLATHLGYDMSVLSDGGEKELGERLVAMGDWNNAVQFAIATVGTGGHKKFIAGVRRHNKVWGSVLADISKRAMREIKKVPRNKLTSTSLTADGLIEGFGYTESIASWIDRLCDKQPDDKSDKSDSTDSSDKDDSDADTSDTDESKRDEKGEIDKALAESRKETLVDRTPIPSWFPLKVERLPMPEVLSGSLGKKRVASNSGKHPRRLHRYLTDPQKRVFDKTVRGQGGIVVIDTSGSMRLDRDDVMGIVMASPGCTVLSYSVPSFGIDDNGEAIETNAYVLASRGRMVDEMPEFGSANAVDLPVLKWAVSERRSSRTPVVWVCDGYVTGHGDVAHETLTLQAVEYCLAHGISIVPDAESAVKYLTELSNGMRPAKSFPHIMKRAYELATGDRLVA